MLLLHEPLPHLAQGLMDTRIAQMTIAQAMVETQTDMQYHGSVVVNVEEIMTETISWMVRTGLTSAWILMSEKIRVEVVVEAYTVIPWSTTVDVEDPITAEIEEDAAAIDLVVIDEPVLSSSTSCHKYPFHTTCRFEHRLLWPHSLFFWPVAM
jgi:hypothetical protein